MSKEHLSTLLTSGTLDLMGPDSSRFFLGQPFEKDPFVIHFGERHPVSSGTRIESMSSAALTAALFKALMLTALNNL
jgi:hypothetical protein